MLDEDRDNEKGTASEFAEASWSRIENGEHMSEQEFDDNDFYEADVYVVENDNIQGDPEAEKKKRKRNCLICPHGKRKDNCVEVMCGGCPHRRRRVRCKDCGGHGICKISV